MSIPIIQMGRRQGKTWTCVQWLLDDPDNRVIVTADIVRARGIQELLAGLTDTTPKDWTRHVLPWGSRESLRGTRREVFIDQADHCLQWMFGGALRGVTWDA